MAIIHKATVTPTKRELVEAWLDTQPWGAAGPIDILGSYRFDDPAGEVGIEALLVRRADLLVHVPLTYRSAPMAGSESSLVGTTQHSVLGKRWVYDAAGDPVAVACFVRALRGEQEQAVMEVWDGDTLVERRESVVRVSVQASQPGAAPANTPAVDVDGAELRIARSLGAELPGTRQLVAEWADGQSVVAALD